MDETYHSDYLTSHLVWSDHRLIRILEPLTDKEFGVSFGELVGSIQSKTAHIVSVYDFFLKIFEGNPYNSFPDLSTLTKDQILSKWKENLEMWMAITGGLKGTYPLPLAENQQVDAHHILIDAALHSVHHRGQVLTMVRLLGKSRDQVHPRDTNLDYLMFLFDQHKEEIYRR